MNQASSIQQLLQAYMENHADPKVVDELRRLSEQHGMEEELRQALARLMEQQEKESESLDEQHYQQLFREIISIDKPIREITGARVVNLPRRRWWWAAASVLIIGFGAALWILAGKGKPADVQLADHKYDVAPGRSGAILVLSDGSKVVLDTVKNGVIALQSGTEVVLANGQLTYLEPKQKNTAVAYNTMTTPKGRQFQVSLPDGSKVWLNAASSLRYPTAFTGTERRVEITGEAYFEVAENKQIPFKVIVNNAMEVKVLGTHFNINAYEDENAVKTSLLSGRIQASIITSDPKKEQSILLKPGEQVQLKTNGPLNLVNGADMAKVMAWKNGLFNFEGMHLREAMRQLSRWYDIEVAYEEGIPDIIFGGKMPMDINLSQLLLVLQDAGVYCRQEADNRLVIIKK